MMRSIAWAYDMTLWVVVIALVGYAVILGIKSVVKNVRRSWGHLRGSHPSQFRDYKSRSR